ncbi:kinase-like domain-containing protein [Amylostereum chailletii]|nr:kinase-like domain-containing protein [Amylostereum chailletii]
MGHSINDPASLIGLSIDSGRLRLAEILGSGGFAVVYRATDLASTKQYAVKCMLRGTRKSKAYTRHMQECDLHARVGDHPNVVTLHRAFTEGKYAFFVFDLCAGGDLFAAIEKGVFTGHSALVKRVFTQLVDAVGHCHARGVYHRDIKPENILCASGHAGVYLADFGLATADRQSSGFGLGSKYYLSPECLHEDLMLEKYPTAASDVWALGLILVNLITGLCPWYYAGKSDRLFRDYLVDPAGFFLPLNVPDDLTTLLRGMLAYDPYDRMSIPEIRARLATIEVFFPVCGPAPKWDPATELEVATQEKREPYRRHHTPYPTTTSLSSSDTGSTSECSSSQSGSSYATSLATPSDENACSSLTSGSVSTCSATSCRHAVTKPHPSNPQPSDLDGLGPTCVNRVHVHPSVASLLMITSPLSGVTSI